MRRLVRHDPHRPPTEPRESHQDVSREVLMHFEEIPIVDHGIDDVAHVVRLSR